MKVARCIHCNSILSLSQVQWQMGRSANQVGCKNDSGTNNSSRSESDTAREQDKARKQGLHSGRYWRGNQR